MSILIFEACAIKLTELFAYICHSPFNVIFKPGNIDFADKRIILIKRILLHFASLWPLLLFFNLNCHMFFIALNNDCSVLLDSIKVVAFDIRGRVIGDNVDGRVTNNVLGFSIFVYVVGFRFLGILIY